MRRLIIPPLTQLPNFAGVLLAACIVASAPAAPADADRGAAILAVTPRTDLPPEADDPMRPAHLRMLKSKVWVDDAGIDDVGNIYNQYRRSSLGTWSNYDESKADPFPLLPDPLVLKNGSRVTDAATWWSQRRPEILADFYTEIYGHIPAETPRITWEVTSKTDDGTVKTQTIIGHIDNASYPAATPEIYMKLSLPSHAAGPVPVIVNVSGAGATAPTPRPAGSAATPSRAPAGPSPLEQVLQRGWGYAVYSTGAVQADNGGGLTAGIIGLVNHGEPRRDPAEWGVLSAWTWGLSRAIDYFATDPEVDPKRLGIEGHSRWGKTALWAAAQDERWAIVYASCSGEGGAKLFRRNFGETTDNIANSHWMAENFKKYAGHWNNLPVDSHELIALIAPRPVFVTGATQDPWSDPHGEFLAVVAAGPVYRLLGKKDVGVPEMPAPNVARVDGDLAFREHIGAHTDVPDWPVFLDYASRCFAKPLPALR